MEDFKERTKKQLKKMPQIRDVADPMKPDLRLYYNYTLGQLKFLDEYKKDLDTQRAAKAVGISSSTIERWVKLPQIRDVMNRIHDAYVDAVCMDNKVAAGRFISILNKLENKFDEGDSKVSAALANMAGNMLKATGHFDNAEGGSTPQVQINIDIGNASAKGNKPQKELKDVTIEVD